MDKSIAFLLLSLTAGIGGWITLRPFIPPAWMRPVQAALFVGMLFPYFVSLGNLELVARTLWSPLFVGALIGEQLYLRFTRWKARRPVVTPAEKEAQREERRQREKEERRALRRAQRQAEKERQAQEQEQGNDDAANDDEAPR